MNIYHDRIKYIIALVAQWIEQCPPKGERSSTLLISRIFENLIPAPVAQWKERGSPKAGHCVRSTRTEGAKSLINRAFYEFYLNFISCI